jgi:HK97 family phage major capsid protein
MRKEVVVPFNTGINRGDPPYGSDPIVPEPLSADIIQELPQASTVMRLARKVPMSTRTQRLTVLDTLPTAYFVSGDSGLKQTTNMEWKNVSLVVEEIAAIVPIPDAYLDDAHIPIWSEVRPRMVEAIAKKIDAATLFGVDKPSTWSPALVPAAIAAGNTVQANNQDLAFSVAELAEKVSLDGYTEINGWAVQPGLKWRFLRMRSTTAGYPIYEPNLQSGRGGDSLYGYPMEEVRNGAWDLSQAALLLGDWSKAMIGTRQDITFKMFDQGVISDDSGNVVWNAMQQDGQAMRVVVRLAWATVNPLTALNSDDATRFPFGVLTAGSASS